MRRLATPFTLVLMLILTITTAHAQAPSGRKFVVYFEEWSAAIDDSARGIILDAAQVALSVPRVAVQVTGFADPTGTRRANELLSELRAQRVVDYLRESGVPQARLVQGGKGSVNFILSSQEARRVEIFIPVK